MGALFALVKLLAGVVAEISGLYLIFTQRDIALGVALLALGWAMTNSARLDLVEEEWGE